MSSKIEIQKICKHCGKEFTARTTVTKYCSDRCAKQAYKDRKRNEKIDQAKKETQSIKAQPLAEIQAKEILTAPEVAKLLGLSNRSVYRMINKGIIKAVNLGERMTRIKRSDLDELLNPKKAPKPEPIQYDLSECYTITDIIEKYGISRGAVQEMVKRNDIPKINKGKFVYLPKILVDQILNPNKDENE